MSKTCSFTLLANVIGDNWPEPPSMNPFKNYQTPTFNKMYAFFKFSLNFYVYIGALYMLKFKISETKLNLTIVVLFSGKVLHLFSAALVLSWFCIR